LVIEVPLLRSEGGPLRKQGNLSVSTGNSEADFGMGFSAVISALDRSERGTSVMARGIGTAILLPTEPRGSRRFKSSRERETQQRNFAVR
jgi:hypothetical protein